MTPRLQRQSEIRGKPSIAGSFFAQTQTNLFKNTSFEASDNDFQGTPLFRKIVVINKNIRTTLKAVKEDASSPGPSNIVTRGKAPMPTVNNDTSAQAALPAPIPFTSCTSAPIMTSKKYQDKVDKTEALKKEKEKNKTTSNERKQLCPMNKSKAKLPKTKDIAEKPFVIKTSLANACRYPKFVNLIQEVVDHITQLVYAPTKRITEEIRRKCKQSNEGTEFISVDEYLASQICNKCKFKQLNNISTTGSKRRVHSVLKSESCGTVWNRDVNSALNIYSIFVYKSKHDNESHPLSKDLQKTNGAPWI
ncbi:hypothetical protein BCV72DRAFT_331326 [Rhizopus microsporus var. microsporus]|uniref:Cas12f1-like TNB domain-containing protein n=2 Tax=Rhizopus microsporus TaxID=58291 RepID=A0A2G4T426_RHIZD|nr:uncharacterized protein RHIMIDRAFT_248607 [Rhizopus microsporus ATCC 52813]ORE05338.1 hypothetical protein BCV72DRAFT_331326 [Rhizopus microsporus var. microsporus]PHZ15436.1 hypothetical protein RHIMIDRAFT_248607 [Rhizopus microsporus ATCC 52813]